MLQSWGADLFYMPHGLTLDPEGNIWVTDVGLQQALKFSPSGKLLQSLGQRLEPGSTEGHFCKPSHVSAGIRKRAALLGAALRATKGVAVGLCCPRLEGSLQGMGCLLLGMPALPAPADTAPTCSVSHLHATQAPGHLTGRGIQGSAQPSVWDRHRGSHLPLPAHRLRFPMMAPSSWLTGTATAE